METVDNLTKQITAAYMSSEVALVGRETFNEIIEAVNANESLELDTTTNRGRQNDIVEGIKLLFQAATFVKAMIDIYGILRQRLDRKPAPEELIAQAAKNGKMVQPEQASEVAKLVVEKLD